MAGLQAFNDDLNIALGRCETTREGTIPGPDPTPPVQTVFVPLVSR
jgi:hypothetical protein